MKNKEITIYELIGLIKDGKAPKQIKYNNKTFTFNEDRNDYENEYDKNWSFLYKRLGEAVNFVDDFLNNTVEILPEENDEWEDIYTLGDSEQHHFMNRQNDMTQEDRRLLDSNFRLLGETINQLIKNQRKIIEKLDKNEIMFDYYVEKLEAKEKLESKDEK